MTSALAKTVLSRVSGDAPAQCSRQHPSAFSINVIFTTTSDTLAALRKAGQIARQLGLSIRIIAPQLVPYPLPLDAPAVDPHFRLREFRTLCEGEAIPTLIDVRLCRNVEQCIDRTLLPNSVVVIGVHHTFWPWTKAKQLVKRLGAAGHHVVPVNNEV